MTIRYNPEQRRLMYKTMRTILTRLEECDSDIASRDVRPDGYSRGNGDSRRSGHGDPTASVVIRILGGEATGSLVEQYFGKIHMVARQLEELDSNRAGLLPPNQEEGPGEEYCHICFRLTTVDHKGRKSRFNCKVWRDGAGICGFCRDWLQDFKVAPSLEMLQRHHDKKRIYRREMRAS